MQKQTTKSKTTDGKTEAKAKVIIKLGGEKNESTSPKQK